MTKVIRKYLGVLAALSFLLTPTISAAFELPTLAVGIGLTGASVHVAGQETDPEGSKGPSIDDFKALEYASFFGEARFNVVNRLGITVGLSAIPGDHEFATESKYDSDLTSVAGGTNTGTSKITGTISDLYTAYIQPTVRLTDMFSVYLSAGIASMNVKTTAALVTSTNFNSEVGVDGTRFGVGVMAENSDGFFLKLEAQDTDYDSFSLSTSDGTTAKVDLDEENVSLLFGKAF